MILPRKPGRRSVSGRDNCRGTKACQQNCLAPTKQETSSFIYGIAPAPAADMDTFEAISYSGDRAQRGPAALNTATPLRSWTVATSAPRADQTAISPASRFLSHLKVSLNRCEPLLLGFSLRDDNTMLAVDLTNPDIHAGGRSRSPAYPAWCARSHGGTWPINAGDPQSRRPARVALLSQSRSTTFADLFEVRGVRLDVAAWPRACRPAEAVLTIKTDGKRRARRLHSIRSPANCQPRRRPIG